MAELPKDLLKLKCTLCMISNSFITGLITSFTRYNIPKLLVYKIKVREYYNRSYLERENTLTSR